jgi:hypothetical protein
VERSTLTVPGHVSIGASDFLVLLKGFMNSVITRHALLAVREQCTTLGNRTEYSLLCFMKSLSIDLWRKILTHEAMMHSRAHLTADLFLGILDPS